MIMMPIRVLKKINNKTHTNRSFLGHTSEETASAGRALFVGVGVDFEANLGERRTDSSFLTPVTSAVTSGLDSKIVYIK